MRGHDLMLRLQDHIRRSLAGERPKRATITSTSNRPATGEIEATLVDGSKIYVHAASLEALAVDDVIYVDKQNMGAAQAHYLFRGIHKSATGSYVPTVRGESSIDFILLDNSDVQLMDNTGVYLTDA